MSIVNGTSTPSALLALQMNIKQALGTDRSINRFYSDFDPATIRALLAAQAAKIEFSKEKDQSLQISFFEQVNGAITAAAITDCDFTGVKGGTDVQTRALDTAFSTKFRVDDKTQRTNMITRDMEIAQLFLQHMYLHAEEVNKRAIAFIEANKGTAIATGTGLTSDADGVDVPAAQYNNLLLGKLVRLRLLNKMGGAVNITGGSFVEEYFNATSRLATDDKNDERRRLDAFNWTFDVMGLGADSDQPIYMVSPFAYAFANKARSMYPTGAPRVTKTRTQYAIENVFVKGLWHEITEKETCLENDFEVTDFGMNTWFKGFLNPTSANAATNTGIIKILKVA